MDPIESSNRSGQNDGAKPARGMNTTVSSTPPITKPREGNRRLEPVRKCTRARYHSVSHRSRHEVLTTSFPASS